MAIDVHSVKSGVSGDSPFQSSKGSANGSDIDFAELMRNSGARIGNSLFNISNKAGITSIADSPSGFDDRPHAPVDDYSDTYDSSDKNVDQAPHHDTRPQSSHHDAHDRVANDEPGYSEPAGENSTHESSPHNNDTEGSANEQSSSTENSGASSTSDETPHDEAGNETAATSGQSANADDKPADQAASGSDNAVAGQGKGANSNAEQILHSLLASAQAGKSGDATQDTSQKTGPGENAVKGLTNAVAGVTKNAEDPTAAAANQGAAVAGAKTKASANAAGKEGFNLHGNPAAQEKAGTASQAANTGANIQAQTTLAGNPAKETAAQQSAQLSKMVGDGPKVSVTVETTGASSAVVSKPSTSLTSSAALIGDNSALSGRGHAAQNANATNAGQAQANTAQVQAQAAVIQGATQNQNNASSANSLKGPVQGALHVGGASPVAAGGGEGVVVANTVNATHQAQHSAATQAANAPRQALSGNGLTDQVSVQITKAVNAGVDKISIHLKPADLGRVDVKMEVSHDGRITAVVTADNKNTLDLLQKDSRELQQALQDAGMQMDNNSLSFNLRGQGEEQQTAGSGFDDGGEDISGGDENGLGDQLASQPQDIISDTRVDIRA